MINIEIIENGFYIANTETYEGLPSNSLIEIFRTWPVGGGVGMAIVWWRYVGGSRCYKLDRGSFKDGLIKAQRRG